MKKFTIDADVIRGAMSCQGIRDIRYYLNGIFIGENGDVVGTDGHALFKSSFEWGDDDDRISESIIVHVDGTVPVSTTVCIFDLDALTVICKMGKREKILRIELVEGRYPDYNRVIPESDRPEDTDFNMIGLNPHYLARTTLLGDSVRYSFRNAMQSVLATPTNDNWPADTYMVIMPTRL